MEFLVAIGLSLVFAFAIRLAGGLIPDGAVSAIAALVGGWRQDAWPRGVQEEDRDTPWGAVRPSLSLGRPTEPAPPTPKLTRVEPTIRSR